MENTNVQEVKMPITYDDLKKSLVDSGRPYDFAMIDRAYALAEKAHGEQRRRSGEPYICHPLSVAQILVELGMDSESIAAALMHDVAEDTPVTVAEIKQKFGPEVALLVDGVTKLTQIKFSNVEDRQAENLRKMLLAMSQDVRVMIIKLCDRLHNMRTGDAWPEQKRRDKALETMEVYAPIAHRLGISNIKEELEDRSLHYLDPVGYETIRDLLNKHGDEFLHQVCHTIARHLSENGIQKATIRHRVKSIYGIYRKMYMQNKDFEEIYDIYAVRIILDNVPECYTALGLIHDMYHPLPNRFKDYISTPKPNGYQSLHTTVIGREAIPFEVQIRTWDMDRMAEYGIAAHWKYKAGITGSNDKLDERLAWVRQLLESQRSSADATDLLSDIKSDLLPEEVFAFCDYLMSDEVGVLTWYGIEGVDYNIVDGEYVFTDLYLNNEDDYLGKAGYNFAGLPSYQLDYMSKQCDQVRQQALDLAPYVYNPTFPFYYKLEEENEIINAYRADLDTYFSENLVAFVMGTRSLDEWDAYVSTVESMGLSELVSVYQAAADRAAQTAE